MKPGIYYHPITLEMFELVKVLRRFEFGNLTLYCYFSPVPSETKNLTYLGEV